VSFYILKHRLRASLFETFDTPIPGSWKKLLKILPGVQMFRHLYTGEVTHIDPRQRAMPQSKSVDNIAYIKAYNFNPQACTSFFGHLGREHNTKLRFRPLIIRLGYLSLAIYLLFKGYLDIIQFDFINPDEEVLKHPGLTSAELASMYRHFILRQVLLYGGFPVILVGFFAIFCMFSIFILWCATLLKYDQRDSAQVVGQDTERRLRLQ
jgi:hypothetical protein